MTTDEALDLALEALATEEYRLRQIGQSQAYPGIGFAITAIKQARSTPVQEPVAFLANGARFKISYDSRQSGGQIHGIPQELGGRWVAFVAADDDCHLKLTTTPAAPVQEPVAWRYTDSRGHYRYRGYVPGFDVEYSLLKPQALYTTPPAAQRPDVDAMIALARADEREACAKLIEDHIVPSMASEMARIIRARGETK